MKNYLVQHSIQMYINVDVMADSEEEAQEKAKARLEEHFKGDSDTFLNAMTCENVLQCIPSLDGDIEIN